MAATAKQKILAHRKEALATYLKARGHDQHVVELLNKMRELADGPFGQEEKDRFAAYASLVDKHWRIVERLLPKNIHEQPDDPEPEQAAISSVHRVIERLVGHTIDSGGQASLPDRSVVPTPLRPEKAGHGESGSES